MINKKPDTDLKAEDFTPGFVLVLGVLGLVATPFVAGMMVLAAGLAVSAGAAMLVMWVLHWPWLVFRHMTEKPRGGAKGGS